MAQDTLNKKKWYVVETKEVGSPDTKFKTYTKKIPTYKEADAFVAEMEKMRTGIVYRIVMHERIKQTTVMCVFNPPV